MLALIQSSLHSLSPSASIITSLAFMLTMGFLITRITKKLRLPNVTAYLIAGVLIGPSCLNLVPREVITGMEFLADIALAFIAFNTGDFFKFETLKKNGPKVIVITIFESMLASILIFFVMFNILHLNLSFAIILAALASATAPASTMMTIRQIGAKGDFVDTLLQVVAIDDIVCLITYSISISVAVAANQGGPMSASSIIIPILSNIGTMALGGFFGYILHIMLSYKHSEDNRLIISIALLFLFCGICSIFGISPLLGCMAMGTIYRNAADDETLFKQLNYFNPPILLLFFVRSGLSFDLPSLLHPSGSVGATPLLVVGVIYFLVRIVGKYGGAFLGCLLVKKPAKVRNYLGLALIPQAGVAIGLAALGARTLGGEAGDALNTIILSSSFLYELIGPASAKIALYLSGSYSTKLEDIVTISEVDETGAQKSTLDLLIERIQKIQEEIPKHYVNEDEVAFTKAAEEQYEFIARQARQQTGLFRR